MTRQLFLLALAGLFLLPDWASAFGHHCWRRFCCAPPVAACPPPPVVFAAPCPPVATLPPASATPDNYSLLPTPTVQPESTPAQPKAAVPETNPVPAPRPVSPGVPMGPGGPSSNTDSSANPKLATPQPAEPKTDSVKIPAQNIPTDPMPMKTGSTSLSPETTPKTPQPAKRKPLLSSKGDSGLPPLPLLPPGPINGTKSTSKSSPLMNKPRPVVDIYPVEGAPPASPSVKRKVGFFNHTDRDLKLTVEGQTITLPKRHYIAAEVPANFDWKLGDGPKQHTAIPTAAPGVEVVIRK
jgi:hypothetical protein